MEDIIVNTARYDRQRALLDETAGLGLRERIVELSKDFKTSWKGLGQSLFTVWDDKLYQAWGYEQFEDYTQKELGIKHTTALKMLKTYNFVEEQEPAYLQEEFVREREALAVPGFEAIDVLRQAQRKRELNKEDYAKIREAIFKEGKDAAEVRKDLTALMKERKQLDPDEEREKRNLASVKRLVTALKTFKKDMETLKLLPPEYITEAEGLLKKLEHEVL